LLKLEKTIKNLKFFILVFLFIFVNRPLEVLGHQPRIVKTEKINISKPEISKAYYGKLSGTPHTYIINAKNTIDLYVNVLVPFIEGREKNVTAKIFKDGQPLATLSPGKEDWKKFFEPFGQSMYWQGPEFKKRADAGEYKIIVESGEKEIRYVLATGEIEAFDGREGLNAILLIPELKKSFFEEPPISFIFSPLGWGYILFLQILVLLVGWVISRVLKISGIKIEIYYLNKFARLTMIGGLIIWLGLLFWAIKTSWQPSLIMISGLALFTAIISYSKLKSAGTA